MKRALFLLLTLNSATLIFPEYALAEHLVQCPAKIAYKKFYELSRADFIFGDGHFDLKSLEEMYKPDFITYPIRADMMPNADGSIDVGGIEDFVKQGSKPQLLCKYKGTTITIPIDLPATVNSCHTAGYCD